MQGNTSKESILVHENPTSKQSTFIFLFAGLVVGDEEGGGERWCTLAQGNTSKEASQCKETRVRRSVRKQCKETRVRRAPWCKETRVRCSRFSCFLTLRCSPYSCFLTSRCSLYYCTTLVQGNMSKDSILHVVQGNISKERILMQGNTRKESTLVQ